MLDPLTSSDSTEKLSVPYRVWNVLRKDGLTTIGDLVKKSPNELLRLPNFGRKSLEAIEVELKASGMGLASRPNERTMRGSFVEKQIEAGLSDQEIRARALECATGVAGLVANTHPSNPMSEFWNIAQQFEAYIRDGVT